MVVASTEPLKSQPFFAWTKVDQSGQAQGADSLAISRRFSMSRSKNHEKYHTFVAIDANGNRLPMASGCCNLSCPTSGFMVTTVYPNGLYGIQPNTAPAGTTSKVTITYTNPQDAAMSFSQTFMVSIAE